MLLNYIFDKATSVMKCNAKEWKKFRQEHDYCTTKLIYEDELSTITKSITLHSSISGLCTRFDNLRDCTATGCRMPKNRAFSKIRNRFANRRPTFALSFLASARNITGSILGTAMLLMVLDCCDGSKWLYCTGALLPRCASWTRYALQYMI